jgi:amidase
VVWLEMADGLDLASLSGLELAGLVRARTVSRREVIAAHLDRVEQLNPEINAVVERRDVAALAEADAADNAHQDRAGLPLDGVPVSIKDHFDVAGMKHTEGVVGLAERRSPGSSLVVERLIEAGAIVIGKCNQPDFQIRWNTVNALYGATRNPRDTTLTAGGSTGGDAAAVAAGMACLGLGVDYGGSVRVPAGFCGIFGLRPSAGRVPDVQGLDAAAGPPTQDLMASIGPLGRTLDDLWTAFAVLAGADPRDPLSIPAPPPEAAPAGSRPRVVRMARETGAIIEPAVERELDRVCTALAAAGYVVENGGIPHAPRAPELWAELVGTELLHHALPLWGDLISDSNRQHIETQFGLFDLGGRTSAYVAAYAERREVVQAVGAWMETHQLVVAPIAGMSTPPLDFDHYLSVEATRDLFDHMRDVVWVNMLSLPSVALPNGIQIVARRFREDEAFAAARVAAQALDPVTVADPVAAAER